MMLAVHYSPFSISVNSKQPQGHSFRLWMPSRIAATVRTARPQIISQKCSLKE
jgi:hypothetical protein